MKNKRKLTKEEKRAYAIVGSLGGKATAKKHGKKHMQEIGRKGAEKRWGKSGNKKWQDLNN